ncbi:Histidine--tRNA ligase [Candidatus Calditenuaceae archaeon HR02]|nr:Histidine--tRNA ligase [Candidatus Calditenuaceae archaeon HR02]
MVVLVSLHGWLVKVPLTPPRGMDDILPEEIPLHRSLVETVRLLFRLYGYKEVETPPVEYYELFAVKSGQEILSHMYVFEDAHGRRLALRPEMTAPIARLVAGRLSRSPQPIRLGYVADCYRLDEPQWGRRRRFYHGGFEIFGSKEPAADAECMVIFDDFLRRVGIKDYYFKVGHVGVQRAIMSAAGISDVDQDTILALLDKGRVEEAEESVRKLAKKGEGGTLFSEVATHPAGPAIATVDELSVRLVGVEKAAKELGNLRKIIKLASQVIEPSKIIYYPGFARGLSYYTGFIFEAYGEGAGIALGGGGRYDGLVSLIGGPEVPGVGFAIGLTRIMQYLTDRLMVKPQPDSPLAFVVPLAEESVEFAFKAAHEFRRAGVPTEFEPAAYSPSEAIRRAERRGARFLVLVGRREAERDVVSVRDLAGRFQEEWRVEEIYGRAEALLSRTRVG